MFSKFRKGLERAKRLKLLRKLSPLNEAGLALLNEGETIAIKKENTTIDYIALSCGINPISEPGKIILWDIIHTYDDGSVMIQSQENKSDRSIIGGAGGVKFVKSNQIIVPEGFLRDEVLLRVYKVATNEV